MNIPIRLSSSAFDLVERSRSPYVAAEPAASKLPPNILAVGGLDSNRAPVERGGRIGQDVSLQLDRLFARLAPGLSGERRSTASLGLDLRAPGSTSRLDSLAELNLAPSSVQRTRLTFGSSTSVGTLAGTYAGTGSAAGATSLRVDITHSAALGANPTALRFTVSDQNGAALFSYDGLAKAGQAISLGTDVGLSIAFSAGTLLANHQAGTAVWRDRPTQVNATALFNDADPDRRPRFEDGVQVGAGSFLINGQRIEVRADDSITSVLERINENVPGLLATFADDRVRLSARAQSRLPIVVSEDSSGFLAATKLSGAQSVLGAASGGGEVLALSPQFARVVAGGFRVGGRQVSVDPTQDTITSVLARMREVAPGLVAFLDRDEGQVVVRASVQDRLIFGEDSSGFLAAVGLALGPELPVREPFQLEAGVARRLQESASSERAGLVSRTLSALSLPRELSDTALAAWAQAPSAVAAWNQRQAPAEATGSANARKAQSAYDRDRASSSGRQGGAAARGWTRDQAPPVAADRI